MDGEQAEPLHLEDFQVGQQFVTARQAITMAAIKAFAGDYDPQPFHLDEEAAATGFFGGLAASGWHTAAVTMRLLVRGGLPIAGGIIGAGVELAWPRPTRPGDVLQVTAEVMAVQPSRSKPERGLVTVRCVTANQAGESVQVMTAKLVVHRRQPA